MSRWSRQLRERTPMVAWPLAATAMALAAGLAPVALGAQRTLAVSALGIAALAVVALRRSLPSIAPDEAPTGADDASRPLRAESGQPEGGSDLRMPRLLFYLGTLSLCLASFRPALGLTISEALFLASFAGCVIAVLRGSPITVLPGRLVAGGTIFAFGALISSFGPNAHAGSQGEILHALYVMLLWVWAGAMVLQTRGHFVTVVSLWAASAAFSGLGALAQIVGIEIGELLSLKDGNRATGFFDHANDLGGAASVALVPAIALATLARPGRRALGWLPVGLIAIALLLSGSIAGMAGASLALFVWMASPHVKARRRLAVVGVLTVTLLAIPLVGDKASSPAERLDLVTSPENSRPGAGSGQARISVIEETWPSIVESPIIGRGLDNTITVITAGHSVPYEIHGAPLAVWYEAGLFGLIGILVLFIAYFRIGWSSVASSRSGPNALLAWSLLAALSAFLVFAMTAPFVLQQYCWFSCVLVGAWGLRRDAPARVVGSGHQGNKSARALRAATTQAVG